MTDHERLILLEELYQKIDKRLKDLEEDAAFNSILEKVEADK